MLAMVSVPNIDTQGLARAQKLIVGRMNEEADVDEE